MSPSIKLIVALLVSSIGLVLASTSAVQCETTIVSRSFAGIYSDHCPATTGVSPAATTSIANPTAPVTSSSNSNNAPTSSSIASPIVEGSSTVTSSLTDAPSSTDSPSSTVSGSSTIAASSASQSSSTITLTSVPRTTSASGSALSLTPTSSQSSATSNASFNLGLIVSAILALGLGVTGGVL